MFNNLNQGLCLQNEFMQKERRKYWLQKSSKFLKMIIMFVMIMFVLSIFCLSVVDAPNKLKTSNASCILFGF